MSSKYPLPYHLQSCCGFSTPWRRANQNCVTQFFLGGWLTGWCREGGRTRKHQPKATRDTWVRSTSQAVMQSLQTEGWVWDSPALKMFHVIVVTMASWVGEVVPTHGFVGLEPKKCLERIANMKHKQVYKSKCGHACPRMKKHTCLCLVGGGSYLD